MQRCMVCKAAMRMPCSERLRRAKLQSVSDYFAYHIHLCYQARMSDVSQAAPHPRLY